MSLRAESIVSFGELIVHETSRWTSFWFLDRLVHQTCPRSGSEIGYLVADQKKKMWENGGRIDTVVDK